MFHTIVGVLLFSRSQTPIHTRAFHPLPQDLEFEPGGARDGFALKLRGCDVRWSEQERETTGQEGSIEM